MREIRVIVGVACFVATFLFASGSVFAQPSGAILMWGGGLIAEDSQLQDIVSIAVGEGHALALRSDGSIVAWGSNGRLGCQIPEPNMNFVDVAAGT